MRIPLGVVLLLIVGLVPAGAQTVSPSPVSQAPALQAASTGASAPPPASTSGIEVGPLKNVKFSGLIQVWYQAGDQGFVDTFRLRRVRLYISGEIAPRAKFMVMVDPARALAINQQWTTVDGTRVIKDSSVDQATRILADAYMTLSVVPHLEVQAGQFKLPMNVEGSLPVQDLPLVERSLMTVDRGRGGVMGDIRDIGVMARVSFANGLEFRAGAFNGLGSAQNDMDKDDGKALVGRVSYRTPVPGFQVGAFAATDRSAVTNTERRRLGMDFRYLHGRLLLQGEMAGGRDGGVTRRGYYTLAAWRLRRTFELAARFDVWDPDLDTDLARADVVERDYAAGASYFISGSNVKWQAEYLHKTYRDIVSSQNVFLTNLQMAW